MDTLSITFLCLYRLSIYHSFDISRMVSSSLPLSGGLGFHRNLSGLDSSGSFCCKCYFKELFDNPSIFSFQPYSMIWKV